MHGGGQSSRLTIRRLVSVAGRRKWPARKRCSRPDKQTGSSSQSSGPAETCRQQAPRAFRLKHVSGWRPAGRPSGLAAFRQRTSVGGGPELESAVLHSSFIIGRLILAIDLDGERARRRPAAERKCEHACAPKLARENSRASIRRLAYELSLARDAIRAARPIGPIRGLLGFPTLPLLAAHRAPAAPTTTAQQWRRTATTQQAALRAA